MTMEPTAQIVIPQHFAFRLLREMLNEPKGRAEDIEKAHGEEYRQQRERVRKMTFRAVSISDQLEQTLFEIYAIIEKETASKYNDLTLIRRTAHEE